MVYGLVLFQYCIDMVDGLGLVLFEYCIDMVYGLGFRESGA